MVQVANHLQHDDGILFLPFPTGPDVARAMGIKPIADGELFDGFELSDGTRKDLAEHAPLWFYVLREADIQAGGAHLGAVGGRIVAEVLIGLLAGDPLSFLSVNPTWVPELPSRSKGTFTLTNLVNLGPLSSRNRTPMRDRPPLQATMPMTLYCVPQRVPPLPLWRAASLAEPHTTIARSTWVTCVRPT